MPFWLPACLPVCLFVCTGVACVPFCVPALCLFALPACLFTALPACFFVPLRAFLRFLRPAPCNFAKTCTPFFKKLLQLCGFCKNRMKK